MDAVKFINEMNRMCKSHDDVCTDCPLMNSICPVNDFDVEAEKVVPIVEKWSREHPLVTNGQKIVELMTGERCIERIPYCVSIHVNADWWDAEYKEERDD